MVLFIFRRRFGGVVFHNTNAGMAIPIISYQVFVLNTPRMALGKRWDNLK